MHKVLISTVISKQKYFSTCTSNIEVKYKTVNLFFNSWKIKVLFHLKWFLLCHSYNFINPPLHAATKTRLSVRIMTTPSIHQLPFYLRHIQRLRLIDEHKICFLTDALSQPSLIVLKDNVLLWFGFFLIHVLTS